MGDIFANWLKAQIAALEIVTNLTKVVIPQPSN
jgi:hypothetical protein